MQLFLVRPLMLALMLCASFGIETAQAAEAGSAIHDPGADVLSALRATSANSSLADHAKVIDRLVGDWQVAYTDFKKDGTTLHRTGRLLFGWVADGRIMQDCWIVDPWGSHRDREVYTDLFYFEPKSATWRVASVDPYEASIATFTGGAVGDDRISIESQDLVAGQTRRWSFNDISSDALVFRDEASTDGGKNWRLLAEYHMTRRRGDAPPH